MGDYVSKCLQCQINISRTESRVCDKCGAVLCDSCPCICEVENTMPVIRRSHLEEYEKCPYMFYLDAVERKQQRTNVLTSIGVDLHELFDKYSNIAPDKFDIGHIKDEFTAEYGEYYTDVEERYKEKVANRMELSINNFYKLHKEMPVPYITEQRFIYTIRDDLPPISCTVDRINKLEDGTLEIVDWKTGRTHCGKELVNDLQVPMYIMLVQDELKMQVSKFRLEYLSEGKTREFVVNEDNKYKYSCTVNKKKYTVNLLKTKNRIIDILENIEAGKYPKKYSYVCKRLCGYTEYCGGANDGNF